MFYVSTGGKADQPAHVSAADLIACGIDGVELSGGLYDPEQESKVLQLSEVVDLQLHNYFPPAPIPFVLNLASLDPQIVELSLAHAQSAIDLAAQVGSRYYGIHAGFLIDPSVEFLGREFDSSELVPRHIAFDRFCDNLERLARYSNNRGVKLLIENNVVTTKNLNKFDSNPFLCSDPLETLSVLTNLGGSVGLLLDVGHLKVSANSLQFDILEAHSQLEPWIMGYHLSDNDALSDSNDPVSTDSWFWSCMNCTLDYYVLEVYTDSLISLFDQYSYTRNYINSERKCCEDY